jgi:hypothetical protein
LAIKDEANSSVFIVEFKVDAELEQKQNPKHEKAFFAQGGYGNLILEESGYRDFARKSYVVLNDSKEFEDGERQGLGFKSKTWADLVVHGESVGGLWTDLIDSLGELGVVAFQFKKLRNMNNTQHTVQAVAMHQTLSHVASTLELGNRGGENIGGDGVYVWYGRNISYKVLLNSLDLKKCIQAPATRLGWFGYQSGMGHSQRAVTFCCGSDEAAKNTQAFMRERMRNGPPGESHIERTEVYYQSEGDAGFGDVEWFIAVFQALADKKTVWFLPLGFFFWRGPASPSPFAHPPWLLEGRTSCKRVSLLIAIRFPTLVSRDEKMKGLKPPVEL